MKAPEPSRPAGRVAFIHPSFRNYFIARCLVVSAVEMQSVAVGWQIYDITRRPLDLGLVGLAQFLPGILLFLIAGHAADRFNRKTLIVACYAGYAACSAFLLAFAVRGADAVAPIYAVMVLLGIVRSFSGPVTRAIMPQLVPQEHFANAVAWNASAFQGATILGPAAGGVIYAAFHGPAAVYGTALASGIIAFLSMSRVTPETKPRPREQFNLATVLAGLRYIWREKLILGSISLDLFAVLLGGATALLPVYARDILKTGPAGLGLLCSAFGVGAAAMAVVIAHRPLRRRAGATMLWSVAGFGAFTVLFGISRNFVLSFLALLLAGAADTVSVIIRGILVQVATPDEMRGRVNAVDMIFIGSSNQLGQFESGITAHWFGTVPAVVIGGIGTLVVTALWAWLFPGLRRLDDLNSLES
jgi:MFS family permease